MNPTLSVIIPVYNEKDTILEIVRRVQASPVDKEIIIVDDFSKDGTREILSKIKEKNVKVVLHDKNYGKGFAIRTGLREVKGKITLIQDADLEYSPEDYPSLIQPILERKAKVVYGTRFPKGKSHPSLIKNRFYLANRVLTTTSNLLYGTNITDEPTCYKVFSSDVLKSVNLRCERFEFCPEVTAKVRKKGHEIIEVPIQYSPRTIEEGKKIKLKDGFEALWTLIKYKFTD